MRTVRNDTVESVRALDVGSSLDLSDRSAKRQRQSGNNAPPIQDTEFRLRQLERQTMPGLVANASSSPTARQNLIPSLQDMQRRIQEIENRLAQMSSDGKSSSAAAPKLGLTTPPTQPRLRHKTGKVKLFPSSHWLHTAEKLKLSDFGEDDVELTFFDGKAELADTVYECRSLRHSIKMEQGPKIDDPIARILDTFPGREDCDRLVGHYMRTFENIYRTVHIPSFWRNYEQYWANPQSSTRNFSIRLGLMMSIGTTFETSDDNSTSRLRKSSRNWVQAAQWWLTGPSEKTTGDLEGIQIFCLLLVCRQVTSIGPSPWLSESSLLNAAMSMGLHRSPKTFNLSPFLAEMRVRIWTTILELVVHGSMNANVPLLLSLSDFENHVPQNIRDADLDFRTQEQLASHLADTSFTETSISILMRQSLPVRLQAAKLIQNLPAEYSYEEAIDLALKLQTACRDIATLCRQHWSESLTMHHYFLDMQLRRYILLLHRPFMLEVQQNPRFYVSQKMCVESATIIASYSQRVQLPSKVIDDLALLFIHSTGSFRGPFAMEIITLLSLDVINQVEETGADHSSLPGGSISGLDPLSEMTRAQRAPTIRMLEHIRDQLLQIIKLGHPTLKRYVFLSGILSQITAVEMGGSVQTAVVKTAQTSLHECLTMLRSYPSRALSDSSIYTSSFGGPSLEFDLDLFDLQNFDISSFCFPSL